MAGLELFRCAGCGKGFSEPPEGEPLCVIQYEDTGRVEVFCSRMCRSVEEIRQDAILDLGEPPWVCGVCGELFCPEDAVNHGGSLLLTVHDMVVTPVCCEACRIHFTVEHE